jgi:hypothetical protein
MYDLIIMPCGRFMIQEPASLGPRLQTPIFISTSARNLMTTPDGRRRPPT